MTIGTATTPARCGSGFLSSPGRRARGGPGDVVGLLQSWLTGGRRPDVFFGSRSIQLAGGIPTFPEIPRLDTKKHDLCYPPLRVLCDREIPTLHR
jgi:hypothetical protein